jgi:hypothetical protein
MEESEAASVNPEGVGPVPVRRSNTRITHQEIKAMKAVTTKAPPAHISALNKLKTMVSDLISSFVSIFSGKKVSQCDINGHVFPKGIWEGEFPRCSHCNKEIRSAEEMGTR